MNNTTYIVVTGAEDECRALAARMSELGLSTSALPTIRIRKRSLSASSKRFMAGLEDYDYILFTSAHAARFFDEALRALRIKRPRGVSIAAVGPATARALREVDLSPRIIAKNPGASALVSQLRNIKGKRILFPRSTIASKETLESLRTRGASVDVIPLYMTSSIAISGPAFARAFKNPVTQIVFLSPSSVDSFAKNLRSAILRKRVLEAKVFAIGTTTASAARDAGFIHVAIARPSTTDGIVQMFKSKAL